MGVRVHGGEKDGLNEAPSEIQERDLRGDVVLEKGGGKDSKSTCFAVDGLRDVIRIVVKEDHAP